MSAYKNSVFEIADHFSKAGKMVDIGSGSQRKLKYMLFRSACSLITQNDGSREEVIIFGVT